MDMVQAADGAGKDAMIRHWMTEVWEIWANQQVWVRETTDVLLSLQPV